MGASRLSTNQLLTKHYDENNICAICKKFQFFMCLILVFLQNTYLLPLHSIASMQSIKKRSPEVGNFRTSKLTNQLLTYYEKITTAYRTHVILK